MVPRDWPRLQSGIYPRHAPRLGTNAPEQSGCKETRVLRGGIRPKKVSKEMPVVSLREFD
jgi:hypothetical protein